MISENEAYLLGILYGKGSIIEIDEGRVILQFKIKFRRPSDQSIRSDNIYTRLNEREFVESLKSKLTNDFSVIIDLLRKTWGISSTIDLPNSYTIDDWSMKEIIITSEPISNRFKRLCEILDVELLNGKVLTKFPFHLNIEESPNVSLAFVQGICDSCSLVPNEASSSYGGEGETRIQLEPSQERWELPIGLCRIFQIGLKIPVNNINWGHPQIRHSWRHQNHQFRVSLKNIPTSLELYRLGYKRDEYINLYKRKKVEYEEGKLCPLSRRVEKGEKIYITKSSSPDLNSSLLDERLRGLNINVPNKKGIIICKLLGCKQCENYFEIEIVDSND